MPSAGSLKGLHHPRWPFMGPPIVPLHMIGRMLLATVLLPFPAKICWTSAITSTALLPVVVMAHLAEGWGGIAHPRCHARAQLAAPYWKCGV